MRDKWLITIVSLASILGLFSALGSPKPASASDPEK
ncbi:hypothetical protein LCGC14_2396620, partial [marine sediment metagenome]